MNIQIKYLIKHTLFFHNIEHGFYVIYVNDFDFLYVYQPIFLNVIKYEIKTYDIILKLEKKWINDILLKLILYLKLN